MNDLCWNEYINAERLTGHCVISNTIGAFCDTGNNLFNYAEVLYDVCEGDCDTDGSDIDVVGTGVEPFEDRNCNNTWDGDPEEPEPVEPVPVVSEEPAASEAPTADAEIPNPEPMPEKVIDEEATTPTPETDTENK